MKLSNFAAAALGASAIAILTSSAKAADSIDFAAAGSSALYLQTEQAAIAKGYNSHYSLKSGAVINDPAEPGGETGNIWITWQGVPGAYQIAYGVSVDSTVGNRAFFNRDTVTASGLTPDNSGDTTHGADSPVPAEIIAAINTPANSTGAIVPINVGLTDITPSDALVATTRSIGLGYSSGGSFGTADIKSDFSGAKATAVAFSTSSRPYILNQLGADPVVVFVNKSDTAAGGFGNGLPQTPGGSEYRSNIDRFTLAGFLSGQLGLTQDLISDPALRSVIGGPSTGKSVTTIIREPLSGTYNTMEYCVPESVAVKLFTPKGQETNITTNPAHQPGAGGIRRRAIGTGESVTQANGIANSLGYAFWSTPNFSGKTNLRYLTVDGVDPIFDNYSVAGNEGNLQPTATPTFRNIKNGSYPIWSILRAVTDQNTPTTVSGILTSLSSSDFVPAITLEVFRSYHSTPDQSSPENGNFVSAGGDPAAGGDVGGAVFPINDDVDFYNYAGFELTNLKQ